ncbi:hypothetical protein [Streptomyces acidiscabies]|uniref:Uncharacterized protein n=1 Tax=Streptomyces acidiscabies TaxID=42234 RepID=A0AAP6BLJ1_9ACTN|nr:hypothetical protein [Streptomyces acidiscabies]MBP5941272.1 hypothetical protein [Streptomyces sp. LBUM 1476]MBZ3912614.1 hypothetical protein [Streptomyces acidiscabies]MDX2966712.1 hypothetical protein [Streptomyces acidiscabies]MDX3018463.1 hypothetical protein [Streptomyces acidiscabies]MDX3796513.1 hypothetical protein [Streptomyces acidiscabies]
MGDGFIRWYRERGAESVLSDQVAVFGRHSVTLAHPATKAPSVINVDGDNVPLDFEVLDLIIGLRLPSVSINWWLSADVNVVDSYAYEPLGCEVQTFWLDGLNAEEAQTFTSAVISTVLEVSTPTLALVCDYRGITDADDWDSLALYGGTEIPGNVDPLLLNEELSRKVMSNSTRLQGETAGKNLTRVTAT